LGGLVRLNSQRLLVQVVQACRPACRLARRLHGDQKQREKKA
jgi:hypothetical protein